MCCPPSGRRRGMEDQRELQLISARTRKLEQGQTEVILTTSNGNIRGILHLADGNGGVIWVCGAMGGLDGPSFGIFRILSEVLVSEGLTSFRLDYRFPGDLTPCITDVVAGAYYLGELNVERVALVGHSFGGAVVIQAGILSDRVKAVVGLSSQTYGATGVERLSPKPLLLIHGERDRNLSVDCSRHIYQWAREPKELVIYKDNGHFLRECHEELKDLLKKWLVEKVG